MESVKALQDRQKERTSYVDASKMKRRCKCAQQMYSEGGDVRTRRISSSSRNWENMRGSGARRHSTEILAVFQWVTCNEMTSQQHMKNVPASCGDEKLRASVVFSPHREARDSSVSSLLVSVPKPRGHKVARITRTAANCSA